MKTDRSTALKRPSTAKDGEEVEGLVGKERFIHGGKPYRFIGLGDIHVTKPYKFIGFGYTGKGTFGRSTARSGTAEKVSGEDQLLRSCPCGGGSRSATSD